jgi:hypothetical protein
MSNHKDMAKVKGLPVRLNGTSLGELPNNIHTVALAARTVDLTESCGSTDYKFGKVSLSVMKANNGLVQVTLKGLNYQFPMWSAWLTPEEAADPYYVTAIVTKAFTLASNASE